ncbi:uncharacterized protein LOC110181250 [Drosophila serrata]|uniref:uncharacterized protein LOC110181250 n=1 Tax=Drosophila serrata TaxID=7274 RepID=UPI000A1CF4B4|nr:uncharacterized protein LOC110181250 [Drosophila serrata]
MISEALIVEFLVLIALYFKYFGNVLYIKHVSNYSNALDCQNITAELEKRLPDYTVYSGDFQPPDVVLIALVFALEFVFKGLYKLIDFSVRRQLIIIGLLSFVYLSSVGKNLDNFGIYYEGHTVYSEEYSDVNITNVDQLVDIIKENAEGITFPRGLAVAGLIYIFRSLNSPIRRR